MRHVLNKNMLYGWTIASLAAHALPSFDSSRSQLGNFVAYSLPLQLQVPFLLSLLFECLALLLPDVGFIQIHELLSADFTDEAVWQPLVTVCSEPRVLKGARWCLIASTIAVHKVA